jgi:glycosyltransferase involved in cell wall biosynthesis
VNVAFLVHYFPPLNSSGARRVLAFSKYLSRAGHDVSVITTAKHAYDGFLTEPLPGHCTVVQMGRGDEAAASPDGAGVTAGRSPLATRVLAIRRALMQVTGQLIDNRIPFALRFRGGGLSPEAERVLSRADVIVSSLPPWPMHLAGWYAAKRFGKPWVADYRDQWSGNHMYPGSTPSLALERRLERKLLAGAAAVTVISGPMEQHYRAFHPWVTTIENGFDAEVLEKVRAEAARGQAVPGRAAGPRTLRFLGTVSRQSIPRNLFAALRALPASVRNGLRVEFFGDSRLLPPVIAAEYPALEGVLTLEKQVPHEQALRLMLEADGLLFAETSSFDSLSAQGVLTTKLFEYLAAGRPIVADIDPATLAGGVIVRSGLGAAVSRDPAVLGAAIEALVSGRAATAPDREYIGSFSREAQTRRLEVILERVVREHGSAR